VECEVVKLCWIDFQRWLYERTVILVDLNVREIIIGFQDENCIMLLLFIILRCSYENKFPNLIKNIITQFLLVEKSTATRNSKSTEFKNMWSCILPN